MYTSQKFSKKLKEAGCELENEKWWWCFKEQGEDSWILRGWGSEWNEKIPAYDILNDICVKYAKEFWDMKAMYYGERPTSQFNTHLMYIVQLLQDGEQKLVEKYILENCLFNPKNKD